MYATETKSITQIRTFKVIDGNKKVKLNKDGTECRITNHKQSEVSSEVYAFDTKEELKAIYKVLDKRIEGTTGQKKQIACRNKLLFLIGMNVGLRASDLRVLKWSYFIENIEADGRIVFRNDYTLMPQKTKNKRKFVTLSFNSTVTKALEWYNGLYPVDDLDAYIFTSRKGNEPMTIQSLCRLVKDTAEMAGITKNIGSHSLRKTWGFWIWHTAEDKSYALTLLMRAFNHSSQDTTLKYIGIMKKEIDTMYKSIDLGIDYI